MKTNRAKILLAVLLLFVLVIPVVTQAVDPTPTPTPTPTVTPTPIVTPTPTPTPTVTPTPTPSPTPTPTPTPTPNPTPTVTPTPTPTVSPTPTPSPTPAPVSAYWSTVTASPVVLIADGAQTAIVAVVVKNSVGAVVPGKDVTVASSRGASDTIVTITGKTGADGIASFKVSSGTSGKSVITAKVGDLTISQTAVINFLPVGSQIGNPTAPNENSGVILYRVPGDHRVYVIKNKKKQWIKSAEEFEKSGYKWKDIKEVSAAILAKYPEAEAAITEFLRAIGDSKVYIVKGGKKQWIKSAEEFNAGGYDWASIKDVTPDTLAALTDAELSAALVKIVSALNLRVRNANSTASAVLDIVKKNEVYTVIEKKNGWYKIKTKKGKEGWIMGNYAKEENEDDED